MLENSEARRVPCYGWINLDLAEFSGEAERFTGVVDGCVSVVIHHCPDLKDEERYIWQPRSYTPPELPVQCPRCRYRLDYKKLEKK